MKLEYMKKTKILMMNLLSLREAFMLQMMKGLRLNQKLIICMIQILLKKNSMKNTNIN